ncbi:MAG TPA: ribosome-associated translation inhibitor RaiA [Actinomycetota bacterium]|jgi:ribosomal subunit interface protein|nr:ribosome-associated translation inhibitor RaiA [Actinomycetota bacterium]
MDLVLKARGTRITDHVRNAAQRKLARLERLEPKVTRLQVEVISEKNPRLGGARRVEAAFETPRRTFHASAQGSDVDSALDAIAEKLERQLRDHNTKRRTKLLAGASRLKSERVAGQATTESPERPE